MNQVTLKDGSLLLVEKQTIKELDELKQFQTKAFESLTEKRFLQPLTAEEFIYILNGKDLLLGVRSEGKLIAFRALLDPIDDPEHLGKMQEFRKKSGIPFFILKSR